VTVLREPPLIFKTKLAEEKLECERELAALLSYFVRELSESNIVSSEALAYAGPSSDIFTKDVAVVAAVQLEQLILKHEEYPEQERHWSSFEAWLKQEHPSLHRKLPGLAKRANFWGAFVSSPLGKKLSEYLASRNYSCDSQNECADVVEKLLAELRKVQEYEDGSEPTTKPTAFEGIKMAALRYIERYAVSLPPLDSYVAALPFHSRNEERKFREQAQSAAG